MKNIQNLLAAIFLLTLIPSSASAALLVSDWTATPTSLSFKITGTIDEGVPFGGTVYQKNRLFIGPSGLSQDPEYSSLVFGTVTSLGGSPTALGSIYGGSDQGAYIFNDFAGTKIQMLRGDSSNWQTGDILNYSISFSDANLYDFSSWDPSGAIVSAGRSESGYANAPEAQYQVGSFASVPDTGSTAALLGAGVAALAFARRRLG